MYYIKQLEETRKMLKKFIRFEFAMYKGDKNWVPPLISDIKKTLRGKNNPLFNNGDHAFFMAFNGKKPIARMLVGTDEQLNRVKGFKQGYFSMFESKNDYRAVKMILDAGIKWLKKRGMDSVIGPLSPSNGDDRKGFVVMGEGSPVLLNAYTKDYYPGLIEKYGFTKNDDHFAYIFNPSTFDMKRHSKMVKYSERRGGFRVDRLNRKDIENEAKAIKQILDNSIPDNWDYLVTPSLESVTEEFKALLPFYDGNYCYIARAGDRPVGFMIILPDFNQVLKKMKGKVMPTGWLKYLYYKRKINGTRALIQMVDREYHKKGVNHAMYFYAFQDFLKMGMKYCEASCVDENNIESRASVERAGGEHYRTYRTYRYNFT